MTTISGDGAGNDSEKNLTFAILFSNGRKHFQNIITWSPPAIFRFLSIPTFACAYYTYVYAVVCWHLPFLFCQQFLCVCMHIYVHFDSLAIDLAGSRVQNCAFISCVFYWIRHRYGLTLAIWAIICHVNSHCIAECRNCSHTEWAQCWIFRSLIVRACLIFAKCWVRTTQIAEQHHRRNTSWSTLVLNAIHVWHHTSATALCPCHIIVTWQICPDKKGSFATTTHFELSKIWILAPVPSTSKIM